MPEKKFTTKHDVMEYFKSYKRVRSVTISEMPYVVYIYVKSWILFKDKHLSDIKMLKPVGVTVRIYNRSLFSKRIFEFL